jgi:hypothetical protein
VHKCSEFRHRFPAAWQTATLLKKKNQSGREE